MTAVSYPGVYVEEIPGGARPIEAAGTSTAAFVGVAERGPDDDEAEEVAVRVTSWEEFQKTYGSFFDGSYLAEGVFSFFNNGGRQCYIVRVTRADAEKASILLFNRVVPAVPGVKFSAKNSGAWGNHLLLTIEGATADPGNGFKLTIRRQVEAGVLPESLEDAPVLETHDNLVMDPDSPNYVVKALKRDSALIEAEVFDLASLQSGFHRGGSVAAEMLPLTAFNKKFLVNVDEDGYQEVVLDDAAAGSADLSVIAANIQLKVRALPKKKLTTPAEAFGTFSCVADDDNRLVLRSGTNRLAGDGTVGATAQNPKSSVRVQNAPVENAAVKLSLGEGNGGLSEDALAVRRPAPALQRGLHRSGPIAVATDLPLTLAKNRFRINVDQDGYQQIELDDAAATSADLGVVAANIQLKVSGLTKLKPGTPDTAFSAFSCNVESLNRLVLRSGTNTSPANRSVKSSVRVRNASAQNAVVNLKLGEANGGVSEDALAARDPVVQLGDSAETGNVSEATLGKEGDAALTEMSYAERFALLDKKTDFSLLVVPGVGTQQMMDLGVAYCANRPLQDVFYIGEVGEHDNSAADAENFRKSLTKANSYGALYYPWVMALDPSGRRPGAVQLPPSGYMAGLYARIDGARGVWKAPAGTEASLNGVVGLETELTDVQQGNLNPISVNCLRRFDLAGVIAWGARTVTSDPEYKYVPVRRTAIMLRRSIYDGIQWAVFEGNDHKLWSALRTNIGAFMNSLFRAGAFQGEKANDAYFVRCGLGDTMVQDDIDRGQVIVLVGFAPLKPAEFVIVRIQQKAGQQ